MQAALALAEVLLRLPEKPEFNEWVVRPFEGLVLGYREVDFAKDWHQASAPSRPPRLAPSAGPALVRKKLIVGSMGASAASSSEGAHDPTKATTVSRYRTLVLGMIFLSMKSDR